jgi:hypothetical protein
MKLLPIGTRVSHFGGIESGHGYGTIVTYNGTQPNQYAEEKFNEAVEMAGQAGMLHGVVNALYNGVRCPYVVKWDKNPKFFAEHPELREQFPDECYQDVYEPASLEVVVTEMAPA